LATVRLRYRLGLGVPRILMDQATAPTQVTSRSVPLEQIASVDLLRILAAVGIVWFHTDGAPYRQIGYAGLPMFLLIFFSLVAKQGRATTTAGFLRRRWDRLLKPWLFWSAVYGLCRLAKAICTTDLSSLGGMLSLETFLAGTCIHLWYLPYAFASGALVYVLNSQTSRVNNATVVVGATLVGVLVLAACAMDMPRRVLMRPLPQWEFGLAAIPLGFAIGRCATIPSRQMRGLLLSMIFGTTLAGCAMLVSLGFASSAIPYGLATALVCLAYLWHARGTGFVAALAPLTLGIYLIHPLVIQGCKRFLAPEQNYAGFIVLAAGVSGLIALGLTRTPLRKFV
jgi:hypothetical protein